MLLDTVPGSVLRSGMTDPRASADLVPPRARLRLRSVQDSDHPWIIAEHRAIYCDGLGWDATFADLVADILASHRVGRDPSREAGWVAELDDRPVGSTHVMRLDDTTAKLRLMFVTDAARGAGAGSRLLDEALTFAAQAGYRRMTLWTNDVLLAARQLYASRGFSLTIAEPHHSFGVDLIGETWERAL